MTQIASTLYCRQPGPGVHTSHPCSIKDEGFQKVPKDSTQDFIILYSRPKKKKITTQFITCIVGGKNFIFYLFSSHVNFVEGENKSPNSNVRILVTRWIFLDSLTQKPN